MTPKSKAKKEISNKITLFDAQGKKDGTVSLDDAVFTGKFNHYTLHQAVLMYTANKRQGSASTKVRNEVAGGGKKPWRQKGTGRARVGSIRNPIWRGGGIVFGPHPRNFKYSLPKTLKRKALLDSLNSKLRNGAIFAIKDIELDEPKTKKFKSILDKTGIKGSILIASHNTEEKVVLACRNLRGVKLSKYQDLNALDVLMYKSLILTEKAISDLTKKFKK